MALSLRKVSLLKGINQLKKLKSQNTFSQKIVILEKLHIFFDKKAQELSKVKILNTKFFEDTYLSNEPHHLWEATKFLNI